VRRPHLRPAWVGAALAVVTVAAVASAGLVTPERRVVAAGPVLGVGHDDTWSPRTPDRTLEPVVLRTVQAAGGVDRADGTRCPLDRLALSWTDPGPGWRSGGFLAPLGPAPTLGTAAVNGVVLCVGNHHAYVGFDALRTADGWDVELVPDPFGGVSEEPGTNAPDTVPVARPASAGWQGEARGPAIEGYARYQGQALCDPAAKKGAVALRDLLLARYPSTSSLGISRPCAVGGRSEHKEGRAFDWGTDLADPVDRAAAADFLRRLLATDRFGNRHALARRMGVMYVIWDHKMWSAYRADAGWRAYRGSSPHTDHVHVSLSWAGARGLTSFWSGDVVEGFAAAPTGAGAAGASTRPVAVRTSTASDRTSATRASGTTTTRPSGSTTATRRSSPSPSPAPSRSPSPSPSPTPGSTLLDPGILDPLFPGR